MVVRRAGRMGADGNSAACTICHSLPGCCSRYWTRRSGRELSVRGEACGGLHVICSIGMRLAALVWTCVEILPHGKICHPELVVSWTSGLSLSHCGYHLTTSISFVPLWFSWMCLITSRVLRALYARYVAGLTTLLHGLAPMGYALTLNVPVNLLYGPSRAHILPFCCTYAVCGSPRSWICLPVFSWIVLQCFAALFSPTCTSSTTYKSMTARAYDVDLPVSATT